MVMRPKQSDYVRLLQGTKTDAVAGRCGKCSGRCASIERRKPG